MSIGDKVIYYRIYRGRPTLKKEAVIVSLAKVRVKVKLLENGKEMWADRDNVKVIG